MPKEHQGLIRRLLVRACPQFLEDWAGSAGARFRNGLQGLSHYTRDNVRPAEKLDAVPEMLWNAAKGATSIQQAQAEASFAKAETDRMDAELRRRTLDARTRHECADADRAEVEARIARLKEIAERIELFKKLKEIGVVLDVNEIIAVLPAIPMSSAIVPSPTSVIAPQEKDSITESLVKVIFRPEVAEATDFELQTWACAEGDRLPLGSPVCVVSAEIPASPPHRAEWQILSPASGTVLEMLVRPGDAICADQLLATILPHPEPHSA